MPAQLVKLYLLHVERRLASMLNDGGGSQQAVNVSASSLQVLADLVAGRSKSEHVVCKVGCSSEGRGQKANIGCA